jgi:hypothetical protein
MLKWTIPATSMRAGTTYRYGITRGARVLREVRCFLGVAAESFMKSLEVYRAGGFPPGTRVVS